MVTRWWFAGLMLLLMVAFAEAQPKIQTGRYTAVYARPTAAQQDPLAAVVSIEFADEISTVGKAVNQVLEGSGFSVIGTLEWHPDVFTLFNLPLPAVHRQLGPLTVIDVLATLVGREFEIVVDRRHRTVAFVPVSGPSMSGQADRVDVSGEQQDEKS